MTGLALQTTARVTAIALAVFAAGATPAAGPAAPAESPVVTVLAIAPAECEAVISVDGGASAVRRVGDELAEGCFEVRKVLVDRVVLEEPAPTGSRAPSERRPERRIAPGQPEPHARQPRRPRLNPQPRDIPVGI